VVDSNITAGLEGQDECSEISGCVVGAITSYTETDPYWTGNYTNGYNNTEWDEAYGWGNHSDAGYLTSYTESDPLWSENESLIYKKTDTYNQTEIDNNLTDQDECSEISGCVEGAITSYTDTNCSLDNSCSNITYNSDTDAWDKNNTDDFISILNFTGTLTNGKLCRYNSSITGIDCDYTDQTGEGGTSDTNASTECNGEEVLLGNSSCLNSTAFFDDTDTDTDTNCSIDQSCSAIIYDTDESGLDVNSSNESLYWNGYNSTNATQFENENGALNMITSWLHGLIQAIVESYGYITTSFNTTYDLTSKDVTANRTNWETTYNASYHATMEDVQANRTAWETDTDTDTNCSVDNSCTNITYDSETSAWDKSAADDFDGAWGSLTGIPEDISDGDNDTTYSHLSNFSDDIGVSSDWDECSDASGCGWLITSHNASYHETWQNVSANSNDWLNYCYNATYESTFNTSYDTAFLWGDHSLAGYMTTSQNDTYDATTAKVNSNETLWANQTATLVQMPVDTKITFGNSSIYIMFNSTTGNLTICNQC